MLWNLVYLPDSLAKGDDLEKGEIPPGRKKGLNGVAFPLPLAFRSAGPGVCRPDSQRITHGRMVQRKPIFAH